MPTLQYPSDHLPVGAVFDIQSLSSHSLVNTTVASTLTTNEGPEVKPVQTADEEEWRSILVEAPRDPTKKERSEQRQLEQCFLSIFPEAQQSYLQQLKSQWTSDGSLRPAADHPEKLLDLKACVAEQAGKTQTTNCQATFDLVPESPALVTHICVNLTKNGLMHDNQGEGACFWGPKIPGLEGIPCMGVMQVSCCCTPVLSTSLVRRTETRHLRVAAPLVCQPPNTRERGCRGRGHAMRIAQCAVRSALAGAAGVATFSLFEI